MRTTRVFLVAAVLALAVFSSVAPGGAPMGPPTAVVGEGEWAVGFEYGRESADLEASGRVTEVIGSNTLFFMQDLELEDFESDMFFGTIAHGVCDNWDLFLRLGAANAEGDISFPPANTTAAEREDDFDASYGFAWGVGSRATFCRSGPWSVGGLVQVTWFKPDDGDFSILDPSIPDETWTGEVELEYWQTQVSLAVMYQADTLGFWGGPFLQFIEGDLDYDATTQIGLGTATLTLTSDLEESAQIGIHAGVNWEMTDQWNLWVEGQVTEDSWVLGLGTVILPEKTFE